LEKRFPTYVYGKEDEPIQLVLGRLLREKKMTIGTVESCTGGSLAQTLVSVAGASDYFQGSFLTYTNELKNRLVDVSKKDLDTVGAVSAEVVAQMAKNGREKLGVDICVSTSGVAGPDGGTEDLPVGTIWIGIATKDIVIAKKFQFGDHRERNIQMTVLTALNLVRCEILGILIEKK
jgi:nicotinamide-nucleotide amidase